MIKYDIPYILGMKFTHRKYLLRGDRIEGLKILDDLGPITLADLEAADLEIQRLEYRTLRAAEYPSLADQLDMIYHGGLDAWKAVIKAVKDKHPKPE
jgi:hypothetical protein